MRKAALCVACWLSGTVFAPPVSAATGLGAPWPMYGGDPAHSREQRTGPALPRNATLSRWSLAAAGWVYGAPCVDEDENVYFSSWDGHLYAASPDGSLRWKLRVGALAGLEEQIWSSPALGAGSDDVSTQATIKYTRTTPLACD